MMQRIHTNNKNHRNTILSALTVAALFAIVTGCFNGSNIRVDLEKQPKFIAVADKKAAYSYDGINWKKTTLPDRAGWFSICYGKRKIATLPDERRDWNVCYGNGKFVAIATDRNLQVAYSKDGIVWSLGETHIKTYGFWQEVTYCGDKFIAISTWYGQAAHSKDGIKWTKMELTGGILSGKMQSITYGNGKFVAISGDNWFASNEAAYSDDGINWKKTTLPQKANWSSVCYGDGKFVAIDHGMILGGIYIRWEPSKIAAYSEDGITWIATKMPSKAHWSSVCYGVD